MYEEIRETKRRQFEYANKLYMYIYRQKQVISNSGVTRDHRRGIFKYLK